MRAIIIFIALLFFTSCVDRIEKKGYSFELSNYELLRNKVSDKAFVVEYMGYPSIKSNLMGDEVWIYFSETIDNKIFVDSESLARRVLLISFNKNSVVKDIRNYYLEDGNDFVFSNDKTKVPQKGKGILGQIFGNIGQISTN